MPILVEFSHVRGHAVLKWGVRSMRAITTRWETFGPYGTSTQATEGSCNKGRDTASRGEVQILQGTRYGKPG